MDFGDKSSMNLWRSTNDSIHGVNDFLNKAFERASQGNEILCPSKKSFNRNWHCQNTVEDHLFCHGFVHGYTKWVFHGEGFFSRNTTHPTNDEKTSNMHDDIERVREGSPEDAKIFFLKLVEEGKEYVSGV